MPIARLGLIHFRDIIYGKLREDKSHQNLFIVTY